MLYRGRFHTNGVQTPLLLPDAKRAHVMSGDTCKAITNFQGSLWTVRRDASDT
jgi:hypothetical protein